MLEPILQQLGASNPQLAQLIAQNPEQFLSLLGEDADDDAPLPPGAQAIAVTEEERDAIERVRIPYVLLLSGELRLTRHSFAAWALTVTRPSRLISPVTKTRSSLPTSCSTSLMMTSPLMPSNRLQPFGEPDGPGLVLGMRLDKLEQSGHRGRCELCELRFGGRGSPRNYSMGSRSFEKKGRAISQ